MISPRKAISKTGSTRCLSDAAVTVAMGRLLAEWTKRRYACRRRPSPHFFGATVSAPEPTGGGHRSRILEPLLSRTGVVPSHALVDGSTMPIDGEIRGVSQSPTTPVWEPLVDAVGEDVASWFMYMFWVATGDGRRVHAYKHIATRCYVHLDDDGNAFYYVHPDRYRPIALAEILEAVLAPWWEDGLA